MEATDMAQYIATLLPHNLAHPKGCQICCFKVQPLLQDNVVIKAIKLTSNILRATVQIPPYIGQYF